MHPTGDDAHLMGSSSGGAAERGSSTLSGLSPEEAVHLLQSQNRAMRERLQAAAGVAEENARLREDLAQLRAQADASDARRQSQLEATTAALAAAQREHAAAAATAREEQAVLRAALAAAASSSEADLLGMQATLGRMRSELQAGDAAVADLKAQLAAAEARPAGGEQEGQRERGAPSVQQAEEVLALQAEVQSLRNGRALAESEAAQARDGAAAAAQAHEQQLAGIREQARALAGQVEEASQAEHELAQERHRAAALEAALAEAREAAAAGARAGEAAAAERIAGLEAALATAEERAEASAAGAWQLAADKALLQQTVGHLEEGLEQRSAEAEAAAGELRVLQRKQWSHHGEEATSNSTGSTPLVSGGWGRARKGGVSHVGRKAMHGHLLTTDGGIHGEVGIHVSVCAAAGGAAAAAAEGWG